MNTNGISSGNRFKAALRDRKAQVGLWLSMADPYLAEVSATAGFDWLLIDGEHAPNDLRSTMAALQAVAPYRSQPVVRAVQGEAAVIKQLLDIGAQNILVPMVDTPEQAREVVSATQYPPLGIRGVGSAVDGIDGVFIGPADLAASMGHRGNPGHPEVQAAIVEAMKTIMASGKAAGTLTSDTALARRYLELGCTFVATGVDILMYAQAARRLAASFLDGAPAAPDPASGAAY